MIGKGTSNIQMTRSQELLGERGPTETAPEAHSSQTPADLPPTPAPGDGERGDDEPPVAPPGAYDITASTSADRAGAVGGVALGCDVAAGVAERRHRDATG